MTAPAYETDLSNFNLAENSGSWVEMTGYTAGGTPDITDTDNEIQGTYHVSATLKSGLNSIACNYGSGVTLPTNGAFLIWFTFGSPGLLDSYANGGVRALIGSALGNFYGFKVGGNDVAPDPYGGWRNLAVDPNLTPDYTAGTPSGTLQYVGIGIYLPSGYPAKGQPFCVDAIRYGRCEARIRYGAEADGYATFAGLAAVNDGSTYRWGLFQAVTGGYQWKGLMTLGYTNAVDFRDSNKAIFIQDTRKVSSVFNKIDIRQSGSRVDWTGINITCTDPSTTASKGDLEVVDDCDVNLSGCTFTDMNTFIFKAASDVLSCVFRRCAQITANDAKFAGTLFDSSSVASDTSQLVWDTATNPSDDLLGCTFIKGANPHHAIEFGTTSPTSITLTNVTFTGFNASNGQNDSALHIKRTSGTVTITISGGTTPSYKSAGATVVIVTSARTVKVIAQTAAGTKIQYARVLLKVAADVASGFPYDDTVTISNSGTTATVTHSGHGLATNDKVVISGASLSENNGVFSIAKIDDNSYSYTMASTPGSSPTGTIKSSFVFLEGETDANGEIYMSRSIAATQAVTGWARKSSASPFYKEGPIGGSVASSADTTFTAVLSPDE